MSTNYYVSGPAIDGVDGGEGLHIGQSVIHRTFLLRAHPERGLTSLAAWLEFLNTPGHRIHAEHGAEVALAELEEIIRRRQDHQGRPLERRHRSSRSRPAHCVLDGEGYEFYTVDFS
ncbi:hypothetical protein [Streptomyces sp. NBC_00470]|uniref:hypothetical protein n=1 Tax=Streptomyces sp. NBC_00470 TaxID=2975753 RepID=UPI002F90869A